MTTDRWCRCGVIDANIANERKGFYKVENLTHLFAFEVVGRDQFSNVMAEFLDILSEVNVLIAPFMAR